MFVRSDVRITDRLKNHERIHHVQQAETTLIGFLFIYSFEWLILLVWGVIKGEKSAAYLAYRNVRFEKEAYLNEKDLNYLDKRKRYDWRRLPFGIKY